MNKKDLIIPHIVQAGLLPLFYHENKNTSIEILKCLYQSGIRILEFTNRGENAEANFKALKDIAIKDMPDLLLGIGTIKTAETAKKYIDLDADFIVSPIVTKEVAQATKDNNITWIPGCLTPTEIHQAQLLGAKLVKIFPGNLVGPSYIQTIKDIFPDLLFMPTGGVEPEIENLKAWFNSGVSAVGMGSKLLQTKLIQEGDYQALSILIKNTNSLIQRCKC